jgi:hypothetical protein
LLTLLGFLRINGGFAYRFFSATSPTKGDGREQDAEQ